MERNAANYELTYVLADLVDDDRVQKLIFLAILLVVSAVLFVVVRIRQGKLLEQAAEHLKRGRLDKAVITCIKLVRRSASRDVHKRAIEGLSRSYRKAGLDVQLRPIEKLKARIRAVKKDKSNYDGSGGMTQQGLNRMDEVSDRFEAFMDELPIPDATGSRGRKRSSGSRSRNRSNRMPWIYAGGGAFAMLLIGGLVFVFMGEGAVLAGRSAGGLL